MKTPEPNVTRLAPVKREQPPPQEVALSFDDNRLASLVFGHYDQNLARIERKLGVQAHANGNQVILRGPREACEQARAVLQTLYQRAKLGQPADEGDVEGALEEAAYQKTLFPREAAPAPESFGELRTRRRGLVRARNAAQDKYLRALRSHELVFAEGPAGTGKTWLAVGHAVSLLEQGVVGAFRAGLHGIVPYYASLGHRPLGYLLLHSLSPLLPVVVPWLLMLVLWRPKLDWQRAMLACGVLFGLASYVVQARGLPYYRYPLLAFLLPWMALDFDDATKLIRDPILRLKTAATLGFAALGLGGLFLAPQSAVIIHRDRWWQTDFITTLEQNVNRLGGAQLSGHIQCIDSVSGCGATMYRMRLVQSTGLLSDFLLFGPPDVPVIAQTRASFSAALKARPPQVIVISSWLHIRGPGEYRKLDLWPAFEAFLAERYTLDFQWTPNRTERWWSREEYPAGYRIYVLR